MKFQDGLLLILMFSHQAILITGSFQINNRLGKRVYGSSSCVEKPNYHTCINGKKQCVPGKRGPICEEPDLCYLFSPCVKGAKCSMPDYHFKHDNLLKFECTDCKQSPDANNKSSCERPDLDQRIKSFPTVCDANVTCNGNLTTDCRNKTELKQHMCDCKLRERGVLCPKYRNFCKEKYMIDHLNLKATSLENIFLKVDTDQPTGDELCSNKGLCLHDPNSVRGVTCKCFDGYNGTSCELEAGHNFQVCPKYHYGYPDCKTECQPKPGYYTCSDLGQRICAENRLPPDCLSTDLCGSLSSDQYPCVTGAHCRNNFPNKTFICSCPAANPKHCYKPRSDGTGNQCPPNFYGSNCTVFCQNKTGQYHCDKHGNKVCHHQYIGSECQYLNICYAMHPCVPGASCQMHKDNSTFSCQCNLKLHKTCYRKRRKGLCYTRNCYFGGMCELEIDQHSAREVCRCHKGYLGSQCNYKTDQCIDALYNFFLVASNRSLTEINTHSHGNMSEPMLDGYLKNLTYLLDFTDKYHFYRLVYESSIVSKGMDVLCFNRGRCENNPMAKTYKCRCFQGYSGDHCMTEDKEVSKFKLILLFIAVQLILLLLFIAVRRFRTSCSRPLSTETISNRNRGSAYTNMLIEEFAEDK